MEKSICVQIPFPQPPAEPSGSETKLEIVVRGHSASLTVLSNFSPENMNKLLENSVFSHSLKLVLAQTLVDSLRGTPI